MDNNKQTSFSFSMGTFTWFTGVVEDRFDPKKLGRLRIRCFGFHTDNKGEIPTEELFWMNVMMPANSSSMNGIGSSPTGLVEGTWVVGFFRDCDYKQDGIIMGTIGGIPQERNPDKGFFDPLDVYPKDDFMNEPDTNRLSRNEKISETIVQDKKDMRQTGIAKALGGGTWDEPNVPDGREYPYNHVKETETGHVEEFDDTGGDERYHRYHRMGTFVEVHNDGKEVRHVVNDKYEIIFGDNDVHIKGECNITVDGDANIKVEQNVNLETGGNHHEKVGGNMIIQVGGYYQVEAAQHCFINAPRIDLNSVSKPGMPF